jgi:hypothetical protein
VHEDDISKTNAIANSILEGKEIDFYHRYIKKDGEIAFLPGRRYGTTVQTELCG